MPRFAANLSLMFTEHVLADRFAAAADAGFTHVEMQFPYEQPADLLAQRMRAAGVEMVLINLPPGDFAAGERGLAGLDEPDDRFHASIDEALRYGEALGAKKMHIMSGNGDPAASGAIERLTDRLAFAADRLHAHGIITVIEPLNTQDNPGYLIDDFALGERIVRAIDRPYLRLLFDIYHRQMMHGTVATALERLMPIVGHVQIAGVPGRHEPDIGELNYPYLFERLDALGYDGFVGCEYRPFGRTEHGLDWLQAWAN
jgi:hydroxypyruvate isomerase